ncbi:TTN [Mytilus edulis]|uniref:TTN n=1 Tax=Mytilus edulis TaxID=6550 RepID=A0A8S3U4C5_MYTED|nr:TTN [Mytilus edulis]
MEIPDELNALLAAMKLSGKEPAWKFSASTDQVTVQLTWTKAKKQEASSSKSKPALKKSKPPSTRRRDAKRYDQWMANKTAVVPATQINKPPAGKRSRIDFDEGFDINDPDLLCTPPVINADSKEAIQTAMLAARPDTPYQQQQRSRSKMKAKRQTDTGLKKSVAGVLEWTVIRKAKDYGQNVTLFCNVSNCCPQYSGWDRWTPEQNTLFIDIKTGRPNRKYDGMIVSGGYTLIIQNLTKQDLNISYSCVYGGTLGERKLLLEQDAFTFPIEEVPLLSGAYFLKDPSDIECKEGEEAIFTFQICSDSPSVILLKDGKDITGNDNYKMSSEGTHHELKLMNTKYTDAGEYSVQVGQSYRKVLLNIKAYFLKDPSDIECKEGEEAIFTFQICSNSPSVILLKDGKDITGNDNYKMSSEGTNHELKLMNTKYTDAGEYSVQVGQSYRKVLLNIKAYFLKDPSDIECKEGEEAIFTFQICSNSPSVILLKDGKDITGNDNYKMSSEGTHHELKLMNTKYTDAGEYSVQVGQSYRKVRLNIKVEEEKIQLEKRIQKAVNLEQEVKEIVSNQDHPSKRSPKGTKDKTNMINPSKVHSLLADKENNRIISADENNDNELATEYTKHTSDVSNNKVNATDTVNVSAHKTNYEIFEEREEREMKKVEQMPDTLEKQNSENSNKSDQITAAISEHMDDILFYVKNKEHKMTSEDAIYLLVVDITDDIEAVQHSKEFNIDSSGEYIDFWLDSIHCFRTDRVYHVDVQNITAHLCPPVIVVCTGIDKITDIEPKWLVDCFRCIMCDDNKKKCIPEDLYELKYRGILSVHLMNKLFSKVPDLRFGDYEPHILDVMEKFDIIVERESTKSYYLPCMIDRSNTVEEIMKGFHLENFHCSPWNALSLQIWESKPVGDDIYQNIIEELCYKIEELKGEFHKLDYKIKAKCSNGDPSISGGRISYEDLTIICKDGEYVCEEHGNRHSKDEIENTWLKHNPTVSFFTFYHRSK